MAIRYIEQDRTFWLDTEHTSYLLAIVDQENFVGHVYYGQKLQYTENTPAPVYLLRTGEAPFVPSQNNRERVSFLDSFPMEYPGNGLGDGCWTARSSLAAASRRTRSAKSARTICARAQIPCCAKRCGGCGKHNNACKNPGKEISPSPDFNLLLC